MAFGLLLLVALMLLFPSDYRDTNCNCSVCAGDDNE